MDTALTLSFTSIADDTEKEPRKKVQDENDGDIFDLDKFSA